MIAPLQPKVVSFDVFGTLVDVRDGSRAAFTRILRESRGGHIDALEFWEQWERANIRHYLGPYCSYREICRASLVQTFAKFGLQGDPEAIQMYFDAFPGFKRFSDVDTVLDRLAGKYRLVLVSNMDDDLLAETALGRRFDLVCTAERARGYKPDGTLFRYLLAVSGCQAAEVFHAGQSQFTDLVGGKPVGLTIAWINRRGLQLGAGVPAPDYEFRDLTPLLDLLQR